jgi:spore germination protein GerM
VDPDAAIAQVYWLRDTGTGLALVPQAVSMTDTAASTPAQLTATLEQLLSQPPQTGDLASTIPANTRLLDVAIHDDGIHVNLSGEFTSGGGSAAMVGRLGQILSTATTLDPSAPVWIAVDGEPLTVLGGEGILVNQPMTRAEFDRDAGLGQ